MKANNHTSTFHARNPADAILLTICLISSFLICWYFHDKGWYAADDGYYGFVSQRILAGDVIHRDFQVLHPGLTYLVNTLGLYFAGGDLVGLRYPLIITTIVQTVLGYKIARKNGYLAAVAAALALTAFGFLQFINPTGNWYTLCIAVFLVYLLDRQDRFSLRFIVFIGFVVGVVFLFRQLSGAITAIAVTVIIFLKNYSLQTGERKLVAGRNLLAFLTLGMSMFLMSSGHINGFIIIGIFPILIMMIATARVKTDLKDTFLIVGSLFLGAFLSAIPIAVYHLIHGSFFNWIIDLSVYNFALSNMAVHDLYHYGTAPLFAFISAMKGDIGAFGGFVFWTALLLAPMLLGTTTVYSFYKNRDQIPVVSIFACIFAVVSIVFEAPIYLVYSTGLIFLALLSGETIQRSYKLLFACMALSVSAIVFQAGESKQQTRYTAINKRQLIATHTLPRTSIKVSEQESIKYQRLINLVETCTNESEKIYAFPISPQINFLTERAYPFRYFILLLGLRTQQDVNAHIERVLKTGEPSLILHDTEDRFFNSEEGYKLLDGISHAYSNLGTVYEYSVYLKSDHAKLQNCKLLNFDNLDQVDKNNGSGFE